MKQIEKPAAGKLFIAYRILIIVLMALIVLIVCGGIFAIFRSPGSAPLFRLGGANARSSSAAIANAGTGGASTSGNSNSADVQTNVFNGIGRLRIPVTGQSGAASTLIISVSFPYPTSDKPFTEELGSKIADLRNVTNNYFSSLPASAFKNFNDDNAKTELLKRYNAILRLGKINALYFSDFMVVE
ncbi:MAG: flagellar basal body-associated FliL family protein [Treponema sp.]|nr:flagellar basal body-associated FliL family protein [Treponema sp.]